ncbi:hypothetical protein [Xanthomonas sp. BRIP62409]|uniref:hypothetical protein n=1 Tax=Xanthomonas sp. BRIP62409 TaxID=2182388 RepID=UPI000F8D125D|nr:hypothetical protein [Xanthomonas sp. BRIP62409]
MEIDDIESLKLEIFRAFALRPVPPSLGLNSPFRLGTKRAVSGGKRISLGNKLSDIKKDDYRLTVNIQAGEVESVEFRNGVLDMAKGEVDFIHSDRIVAESIPNVVNLNRPLVIGSSVGHPSVAAGSIGLFPRSASNGKRLLLSCAHIIAPNGNRSIDKSVIQPGACDGGISVHTVAALDDYISLNTIGVNYFDAAIAVILPGFNFLPLVHSKLCVNPSVGELPQSGEVVHKIGRTTGSTTGKVYSDRNDNVAVEMLGDTFFFDDLIEIWHPGKVFSLPGDSGSAVFTNKGGAVALLFAGAMSSVGKLSYAHGLTQVFCQLGLDKNLG